MYQKQPSPSHYFPFTRESIKKKFKAILILYQIAWQSKNGLNVCLAEK